MSLSIDTDISAGTDLLGKTVSDLQTGVAIGSDGAVTGTLKYISDYTGFSDDPTEQVGNYLAIHCTADVEGAAITAETNGSTTLGEDGILVARITNKDTQTVTITASKDGYQSTTKVLALTGLTCEDAPAQEG